MSRYEKHIFVCNNRRSDDHPRGSCGGKGSDELVQLFRQELAKQGAAGKVRTNKCGCLDACEEGPVVVVYPDAVWYGAVSAEDVSEIVAEHILGGVPVQKRRI